MSKEIEIDNDRTKDVMEHLETQMVWTARLPATYKNVRKLLGWIAKERNKYANQLISIGKTIKDYGDIPDRKLKRLIKAEMACDALGIAWYDTLQWAEKLWFLPKIQKDEKLRKLITPRESREDKQREVTDIVREIMRHAHPGTPVPGFSERHRAHLWWEQEGSVPNILPNLGWSDSVWGLPWEL